MRRAAGAATRAPAMPPVDMPAHSAAPSMQASERTELHE
jgi:hypothetical protein